MPSRIVLCLIAMLTVWVAGADESSALPSGDWNLLFADEFDNTTQIDTLKWQTKYPWGRTHNHGAYMADENVIVGDGVVTLRAIRESHPNSSMAFTSGVISTGYSKFVTTGGYIEAKILLPNTTGSWPAFWGLESGWPPEMDIMEYPIGAYTESEYHTAFHYSTGGGNSASGAGKVNPGSAGDLGDNWHTFGARWVDGDYVDFYFDGSVVSSIGTDSYVDQMDYMYLILNYAVGGWPGTPSQSQWPDGHIDDTLIDWVRVWKNKPNNTNHTWTLNASGDWGDDANWSGGEAWQGSQNAWFGDKSASAIHVEWDKLKTVGHVHLNGDTAYSFGDGSESLQMAAETRGDTATINAGSDGGEASHTFYNRIDVWSDLQITNTTAEELVFEGEMIGNGDITLVGPGTIRFKGDSNLNLTHTIDGATLRLDGKLYQDPTEITNGAKITVQNGGTLRTGSIVPDSGNLGGLHAESTALVLDDATLYLDSINTTSRGFTIGNGGATIIARSSMVFETDPDNPGTEIISTGNGTLTLDGFDSSTFDKAIPGGGGLRKVGSGKWSLGQANTYTGTTEVEAGELEINSTTGHGNTTVKNAAILSGGGLVRSDLIAESGSIIQPGGYSNIFLDLPLLQDVMLNSGQPTTNQGGGDDLRIGSIGELVAGRAVLSFDLSAIPVGTDILSATLTLTGSQADASSDPATPTIELWELLTAFDEDEATWNAADNGTGWTPGGDLGSLITSITGPDPDTWTAGSTMTFDDMLADFLETKLGQSTLELLLKTDNEIARDQSMFTLASSEDIDAPLLQVNYEGEVRTMRIGGDFLPVTGATVMLDLYADGDNNALDITGQLAAAGTITVGLADGFNPDLGDTFDLFDFGSLTGSFDVLNLPTLSSGLEWDTTNLLTDGSIAVVAGMLTGDFNLDGAIDGLDIDGFVSALVDPDAFLAANPGLTEADLLLIGDINTDGAIDGLDIDGFIAMLTGSTDEGGPRSTVIPEPTSLALLALGAMGLIRRRHIG